MKSIIFDFDGTLIDSAEHIYNCYYLVTKKIAPHLLFKVKELIVGPTLKETIELILGKDNKDLFDIFLENLLKFMMIIYQIQKFLMVFKIYLMIYTKKIFKWQLQQIKD